MNKNILTVIGTSLITARLVGMIGEYKAHREYRRGFSLGCRLADSLHNFKDYTEYLVWKCGCNESKES